MQNFDFLNGKLVYTKSKEHDYAVFEHHWFKDKMIEDYKHGHGQSWGYDNGKEYLLEKNKIFKEWCHGGIQKDGMKLILCKPSETNSKLILNMDSMTMTDNLPSYKHIPQSLMICNGNKYITTSVKHSKDNIENWLIEYDILFKYVEAHPLNQYISKWLKPFVKNIEAEGSRYYNGKKLIGLTARLKWLKRTYINFIFELED